MNLAAAPLFFSLGGHGYSRPLHGLYGLYESFAESDLPGYLPAAGAPGIQIIL